MDYEWKFFICNSEGVFGYTLYIIYTRENFLKNCFCGDIFFENHHSPSRFLFFKYVTWRFSPCGRIYFFFCLDTKEEVTRRKNQGYVSGPTPERPFWRWKMNSLRCTTLRQHFSAPPGHSYAHAPTPRPIFFFTPRRFAVGFWFRLCLAFGFYYLVLYTFTFTLWNTYQYRIENSAFSHGILYT